MADIQPVKNGALYIRVSTHLQEELSPDAQKRLLMEYAEAHNIIVLKEHIYIDSGISGRSARQRPQFNNMIAEAKSKEHPFDVILVWKYSRFARNQEESIVYKSMLKRENVDVISVSEPISDDPFGSLIERIIEWMDEYYSIRLSGEVSRGMAENAMRGNYQARPPLGYRIPGYRQTPVIVPEEAELIQLIFDLYTEKKMGIFEIVRYLNEHGYQTGHKKPFQRRSVTYILKNPTYIGKTIWNQHDQDHKLRDKSEWIIADGTNCPILGGEATFSFGEAIKYLKRGMKVARKGWNGKKQYIQLDDLPELPRKGLSDPCSAGFFRCILGNARTFLQIGWTKHRFSSCQNAIARSVCLSNKWMRLISTAAVMVSPA